MADILEGDLIKICYPLHGVVPVLPAAFTGPEQRFSHQQINFTDKTIKFQTSLHRDKTSLQTSLLAGYRMDLIHKRVVLGLALSIPI